MKRYPPRPPRNWGTDLSRSLGLALYALGNRGVPAARGAARPPRPAGRLVWLNTPGPDAARSAFELARRLIEEDGAAVLLTCPVDLAAPPDLLRRGLILQPPPADTAAEARSFVAHWCPEAAVFTDGALRPALIHEAAAAGIPLLMADARAPRALNPHDGWYPGLYRGALAAFRQIFAVDEASARALRKAGAPDERVFVTGRMEEESAALPCLEAERSALARQIATRPVWLAAAVPEAEEAAVIAAHAESLRLAHRLLLILVPQNPERGAELAARIEAEQGWIVALRARDEEPTPETEVYIPDSCAEMGLWYRLAPISFMGGSLSGEGCNRNPLEPAALGSAITYGPRPGIWGASFGRLGAARAARAVASARDLAEALGDLMQPDRAARLAQAAWAVASDGAEVTERVMDTLHEILDGSIGGSASGDAGGSTGGGKG